MRTAHLGLAVLSLIASAIALPAMAQTIDGAALYTQYCASCHGSLANSSKKGASASTIQSAINGVSAMKSLSFLTSAQVQAIATALSGSTTTTPATCTSFTYSAWSACLSNNTQTRTVASSSPSGCTGGKPVLTQSCTYTAPTTTTDGAALYTQYCASCHGSLSNSSKKGASASTIQIAINNVSAMSSLKILTSAQVQAIATALGGSTTTTPPPTIGACGSCHAIPPNTGKHVFHVNSEGVGCATCHGTGYDASKQTVNANTHQDGKVELTRKLHWDTASHSCSPGCHGTKVWATSGSTSGGGDGGGHEDDIVIVEDAGEPAVGGCSSAGGSVTVIALAGLGLLSVFRRRRTAGK